MNYFERLNSVNVNDMTEKKNNLTYLSWAHAWRELKKLYPRSYYTVYQNDLEWNYFTDNRTAWVKTGVTVVTDEFEVEHIEYLPVMDYRNKSIPADLVTSFDVNKAIQRSLTKAVARHGLGLYIYAGEDLPDESDRSVDERKKEAVSTNKETQKLTRDELEDKIVALCDTKGKRLSDVCKIAKVNDLSELSEERLQGCIDYLQAV